MYSESSILIVRPNFVSLQEILKQKNDLNIANLFKWKSSIILVNLLEFYFYLFPSELKIHTILCLKLHFCILIWGYYSSLNRSTEKKIGWF